MKARWSVILLATIGMGCADQLSEEECLQGDWQTVGFEDGATGQTPDRVEDRIKRCQNFDVNLDQGEYERGRQEGLARFCCTI